MHVMNSLQSTNVVTQIFHRAWQMSQKINVLKYVHVYLCQVKLGHHKLIFLHSSLYSWTWTIADIRSLVCHQRIVSFFYLCSLMSAVNAAQSIITTVHNEWARISLVISEMKLMIFYMSSKKNFEQMCTCYTCLELNIHDKTHSQSRKTSFFTKV